MSKVRQTGEAHVRTVASADRKKAVATVALAFASDPMMRWSFPDPARYLAIACDFIDAFGGHAAEHGSAEEIADFAAVALWLPPGVVPDGEAMGAIIGANMPADRMEDGGALVEQMNRFHPKESHWYLPLIGADPVPSITRAALSTTVPVPFRSPGAPTLCASAWQTVNKTNNARI